MKAIELWDLKGGIFLTLKDVMTALPVRAFASSWSVGEFVYPNGERYFEVASVGDDHISQLEKSGTRIGGNELASIAQSNPQVIWASFRGYQPDDADAAWLTLHAIDSTYWRCETDDISARRLLMRAFNDVRLK